MTARHLDDDALSALLDGEAPTAQRDHVATCASCQSQLAALSTVARAVGAPVPSPTPRDVDAAIARAMAERARAPGPAGVAGPATWVPEGRGEGVRRGAPWLAGVGAIAAAVLVVCLVVVGAVVALSHLSSSGGTAESTATPSRTGPSFASGYGATPAVALPPGTVRLDFGEQDDPAAVVRLATAALSPTATTAPQAAGSGASSNGANAASPAPLSVSGLCIAPARAAVGLAGVDTATVKLYGTLLWRRQPAVTVVFSGPLGLSGVVMGTSTCGLLSVLPF